MYYKFKWKEMVLPDFVVAFMLLVSSRLHETEIHIAMAACE